MLGFNHIRSVEEQVLDENEQVLMAIIRSALLLKKESSAFLQNYGLTFSQYHVLRILNASENGQNTITNVSRIMLVSGANLTGVAKRLEKNGFLIRKSVPNDERITLLEITPKGKLSLENVSEGMTESIEKYFVDVSDDEKKQFMARLIDFQTKAQS